eukprot:2457652-Prymnesium_polylepis.1
MWGHGHDRQMVPRPDIHLQHFDPTYAYTRRHFAELWERYEGPIFVFDLIRQTEQRRKRETILGHGLSEAVTELRKQFERDAHPLRDGLRYVPFDFKKESKRKGGDLLQTVERIAAHFAAENGFFCSRRQPRHLRTPEPLPAAVTPAEEEA